VVLEEAAHLVLMPIVHGTVLEGVVVEMVEVVEMEELAEMDGLVQTIIQLGMDQVDQEEVMEEVVDGEEEMAEVEEVELVE